MHWYIIEVTSTKEAAACAILRRLGYRETFYPQRKVDARPRGKAKRAASRAPRWAYRAWVPGYVFLCADRIETHRITGSHGRVHMRVLCPGGEPYRVTDEDMARMKDVPKRVRALIDAVRRREREEWERRRPQVGALAKLVSGPLSGSEGVVREITGDQVRLEVGPLVVTAQATDAERVQTA
jgi:transcription antitermination factor NusG